eukprot:SAG11_NODE_2366_length_3456_cov_1.596068_6_plen_158_part_00
MLHTLGWESNYCRKDYEGREDQKFRLCEGDIPETVAASFGQRKRWAKGAIQILLMEKNEAASLIDPKWYYHTYNHDEWGVRWSRRSAVDGLRKRGFELQCKIFYIDSCVYPFGSFVREGACPPLPLFLCSTYLPLQPPPLVSVLTWSAVCFLHRPLA